MTAVQAPLVTGATGFVGGHLARRLCAQGARPRLLVRDAARLAADLRDACDVHVGDLDDLPALREAVRGVDTVFHCAGNVNTWGPRATYERANVTGVRNLLEAVAQGTRSLRRFVHISTVDVYGFPLQGCDEHCATRAPGFGYGDSKLAGEQLVRKLGTEQGLPWVILRPTNIMGPGSPFIRRIGKELRSGLMLTVDGGRCDAGFLYIDNLVDCLVWAAKDAAAVGEIYNVSDPEPVSWKRFLHDFRQGIAGKGWLIDLPYPLAQAAARVIAAPYRLLGLRQEPLLHPLIVQIFGRTCGHSADKLARAGGPVGRIPYAQAMATSVAWFLQNSQP